MSRSRARTPRLPCATSAATPWTSQGHEEGRELTEDDQKKLEEETQKLTDKYVKLIDDTCADKNKEIMEV